MSQNYLCLDVGGTQIKSAVFQSQDTGCGKLKTELLFFPAYAEQDEDQILSNLIHIMEETLVQAGIPSSLSGIAFAFPGPFDYQQGVCLMQGIGKYDSIYGLQLPAVLRLYMQESPLLKPFAEVPIRFINDVAAFALGELFFGCAKNTKKSICVCIGTGCGSAFTYENRLAGQETPGVPDNGYIYPAPFKDSILDDYLSRRGLEQLTQKRLGSCCDGLLLSSLCQKEDPKALDCFREFGIWIAQGLAPFLTAYKPDCLILGGQIMKSGIYFLEPLNKLCQEQNISLQIAEDTSLRAIQGLSTLFKIIQ